MVIYDSGNRPSFCPLMISGDDDGRAAQRREIYRLWAFGLVCLSNRFMADPALLERHRVSGHVPSLAPWQNAAECLTRRKSLDMMTER